MINLLRRRRRHAHSSTIQIPPEGFPARFAAGFGEDGEWTLRVVVHPDGHALEFGTDREQAQRLYWRLGDLLVNTQRSP